MFKFYAGFILFFYCSSIYAQPGPLKEIKWAWISGDDVENSSGDYGILEVKNKTNMPVARSFSCGWTAKDGNLWLFGGTHDKEKFFNDVWEYNPSLNVWVWVSGDKIPDQPGVYTTKGVSPFNKPGARRGATSWTDASGNFWLFGGDGLDKDGKRGWLNDLWQYVPYKGWMWVSGTNVTGVYGKYGSFRQSSLKNYPGGREGALGWADKMGNLWLFGGEGYGEEGSGLLNDLWQFNTRLNEWQWVSGVKFANELGKYTQKNNSPGARKYSTGWANTEGKLCFFGGYGYAREKDGYLNDMWAFDVKSLQWNWMGGEAYPNAPGNYYIMGHATKTTYPGGRSGSVNWLDSIGNLYLFGGYGIDKNAKFLLLNDLWRFDYQKNIWTWVSGSDEINQQGAYGTKGIADVKNTPGARGLAVSWLGKSDTRWLFGGAGFATAQGGYLNDLWRVGAAVAVPPSLFCPASVVTENDNMHCAVKVDSIDPAVPKGTMVKFELSGAIAAVGNGSAGGLAFNMGTTTVRYSLHDNPQQSCSFTVTVKDHIKPVPIVKELSDIIGQCSIKINDIPTAKDNCAGQIKGVTKDATSYTKEGKYTITWVYDDGNGNVSTQTQKVIVQSGGNTLSPVVTNLPDVIGECAATVTTVPQASKNCGGFINGKTTLPLNYSKQGIYSVLWTYDDGAGHTATQAQKVIVKDKTAPLPAVQHLPDIVAECTVIVNENPLAIDNCAGSLKAKTRDAVAYNKPGEYSITWVYDDGNGNSTTQKQKIVVKSMPGPLTLLVRNLPDLIGNCTVIATLKPIAYDKCLGYVVAATTDPLVYKEPGTYIIHWKFIGSSDTILQNQNVVVKSLSANVSIFPNPANNYFTISFKSCKVDERISFSVFDVLGRALETNVVNAGRSVKFGINYPMGAYFVQVRQGDEIVTKKLIKLK